MNRRGFIIGVSALALFTSVPKLAEASFQPNVTLTVSLIDNLRTLSVPAQFGSINVRGSIRVNDGGGGIFNLTTVNPGADNGGTIIHSNTPGYYFVRQFSGPVEARWFGLSIGTGITGSQRTANSASITAAISAASLINSDVDLGPDTIEFSSQLVALNGVNVFGRGNVGETNVVSVFKSTQLSWYGNGLAIDMLGTSSNRIQACWSQFTLTSVNNPNNIAAQGIRTGWNQRGMPVLANVTVTGFGDWGVDLSGSQWNVSFPNLRIDGCGILATNSCGLHSFRNSANPADDYYATIVFDNLQVEGCGVTGSTAGGINIQVQSGSSSRGMYFTGQCIVEGNKGTDEIYVTNMWDVHWDYLYNERLDRTGQACCLEVSNVTGGVHGGYMTGENPATNINAIQIKTNSEFTIENVTFNNWLQPGLVDSSSALHTGDNWWAVTNTTLTSGDYNITAGARCNGIIKPSVMVNKGGVNQTGVGNGTVTKVSFSTARIDLTKSFSTTSGGLLAPRTLGAYNINACVKFTTAVDATRIIIWIYRNGAPLVLNTIQASGAGEQSISISTMYTVGATSDYFEVFVRQDSGSVLTISGDTSETWFAMTKV